MENSFLDQLPKFGGRDAMIYKATTFSYSYLLGRTDDWGGYLDSSGVVRGNVVMIEGAYSPEVCAALADPIVVTTWVPQVLARVVYQYGMT